MHTHNCLYEDTQRVLRNVAGNEDSSAEPDDGGKFADLQELCTQLFHNPAGGVFGLGRVQRLDLASSKPLTSLQIARGAHALFCRCSKHESSNDRASVKVLLHNNTAV